VVNRGNYRRNIFTTAGDAQAFVSVLEETSLAYGWRIYAYVVMRNHYHVVLQTPRPNLVDGMHWLQSTLGTRFNRFRSEQGHMFQGRYHAGLIEDTRMAAHVVDYVHLNPTRAGIIPAEQSAAFRWSSLSRFVRGPRFPELIADSWLNQRGLKDTKEGWIRYQSHLNELAANLEEQKKLGWKGFSTGWAIGSESWKTQMAREHARTKLNPGLDAATNKALKEALWESLLLAELKKLGRSLNEIAACRCGEPWKVQMALHLRSNHGVSAAWLSRNLSLGTADSARSLLSQARFRQNTHYSA
jgi:REP element-mobilizing transposase RayT